jgi:hypothetical protein
MTVAELIEKLQGLPPGLEVFIWDDGTRMRVVYVDDSLVDDGFIDLNTDTEK